MWKRLLIVTVDELHRLIDSGAAPLVLDVRSGFEFNSGHIPAAVHAPLMSLVKTTSALPCDKESLLVLTCEHGPRAQLARMMLKWSGFRNIELLDGHMACWRRSGHPLEKGN